MNRVPGSLSRRELVAIIADIAAAAAVCWTPRAGDGDASPLERLLRRHRAALLSMRWVGRAYLSRHPAETLADLLAAVKPERGFDAIDAEIREQLATGQFELVDGWVLAQTEARLCAVVALGT